MVGLSHVILEMSAFPDVVRKGVLTHHVSRVEGAW